MDNNNFFFSDEYKKAIANMSSIAKSILPQIENLSNDYLCQQSSMQGVKSCSDFEIKNLVSDFAKGYKQLSDSFPSFQLSEEVIKYIQETKESEGLSEKEFEERYGEEIKICRKLGEKGWVVSGYLKPGDPKKWYDYIVNGEEKKIVDFFEEDNEHIIELIRRDLEKKYTEPNNKKYFLRGFSSFQNEDYMTAAMYLVALIEVRVNELVQFPPNTKYRDKYSNKGFKKVKDDHYNQTSFPIQKKFYFLNVYPSVIKFLARLFVEGKYKFENGIEPPYISRNWLLHGRSSREIERWECIQLLNALDTIENVLGDEKIQKQNDCLNETEGENQWIEKRKSVKRERQHKMRFIL